MSNNFLEIVKNWNEKQQFITNILEELMVFLNIIKLDHIIVHAFEISYQRLSQYSVVRTFKLLDEINSNNNYHTLIKITNELLLKMDEYVDKNYRNNQELLLTENDILSLKVSIHCHITDILKNINRNDFFKYIKQ